MANLIIPGSNYSNLKIDKTSNGGSINKAGQNQQTPKVSFEEFLGEKNNEVKFSSHAQKRIEERKIKIDKNEMEKLRAGIDKLKEKGGRDSVVMLNEKAYVVSVKNNTVVTVVDGINMKENVFTNIDSMIIV